MTTNVTDPRSNANDQIDHAVRVIAGSSARRAVFTAICTGRKAVKTVSDIEVMTGLNKKQVLTAARHLVNNHLFNQTKVDGETAYEKDTFLASNRRKIVRLVADPRKLEELPTKTRPRSSQLVVGKTIVKYPKDRVRVVRVTIDDIDAFSRVRKVAATGAPCMISEAAFKRGVQAVLSDCGTFTDWGGERNDLWTTRLRVKKGKRVAAAFAFKGPGQRGKLTPAKLGKNGDQIQRLFGTDADVFLVQYWAQVDETVSEQMRAMATVRSLMTGSTISYGIIDGDDTARLVLAYPDAFK